MSQKPTFINDVLSSCISPPFYLTTIPKYTTSHTVFYVLKICFISAVIRAAILCLSDELTLGKKLDINWDQVRGAAAYLWPENLEIYIPTVGNDNRREIRINKDLPFSITIPKEIVSDIQKNQGTKSDTPSTNTQLSENPNSGIPILVFANFGNNMKEDELKKQCLSWNVPYIIGKSGVLICNFDGSLLKGIEYYELEKFSSFLPEKINRSFFLALVDTIESLVSFNLPLIIGTLTFTISCVFLVPWYLLWWAFQAFIYGIITFIIISVINLAIPRFPYTFGEILQLCSFNLTIPFAYSFIRSDSLGGVLSLCFLLWSIAKSKTQ